MSNSTTPVHRRHRKHINFQPETTMNNNEYRSQVSSLSNFTKYQSSPNPLRPPTNICFCSPPFHRLPTSFPTSSDSNQLSFTPSFSTFPGSKISLRSSKYLSPSTRNRSFIVSSNAINTDMPDNNSEEENTLDSVTDTGAKRLESIRSNVNEELNQAQQNLEQWGSDLIEKETQTLLDNYKDKKEEILKNVANDRDLIEEEIEKLQQLLLAREKKNSMKGESNAYKVTFAVTGLFTIGALYYAWNGVVDSDSTAIQNATIDACAAAVCGYFLSRKKTR